MKNINGTRIIFYTILMNINLKIFTLSIEQNKISMSFHISNDDIDTGTGYSGSFNLTQTIGAGVYTLDSQYIDSTAIPWMWNGCKALRIISYDVLDTQEVTVNFDYAAIGSSNNTTTIAASFASVINTAMNGLPGAFARTVTVIYTANSTGNFYTFTFNDEVTMAYSWSGSTIKYVFDKNDDEKNTEFIVYANQMITNPKFLEMKIDQSISEYSTSRTTRPTLLLSTKDSEFTGQELEFVNSTSVLSFNIYRCNVPISVVPITNKWDLVFS